MSFFCVLFHHQSLISVTSLLCGKTYIYLLVFFLVIFFPSPVPQTVIWGDNYGMSLCCPLPLSHYPYPSVIRHIYRVQLWKCYSIDIVPPPPPKRKEKEMRKRKKKLLISSYDWLQLLPLPKLRHCFGRRWRRLKICFPCRQYKGLNDHHIFFGGGDDMSKHFPLSQKLCY